MCNRQPYFLMYSRVFWVFFSAFLLTGCSMFAEEPAALSFRLSLQDDPGEHATLQLQFIEGIHTRTVGPDDFEEGRSTTRPFSVSTDRVLIFADLIDTQSNARTRGVLRLPIDEGWRYEVQVVVGSENPEGRCFGCMGSVSFALDPALGYAATDSLFLVWGGTSIENPVLY